MIHLHQIASRDFIIFLADQTAGDAKCVLERKMPKAVIVRRLQESGVSQYLYSAEEFFSLLTDVHADSTLEVILDLDTKRSTPTPVFNAYDDAESVPPSCVVADGDEVIGFFDLAVYSSQTRGGTRETGDDTWTSSPPLLGEKSSAGSSRQKDPPRSAYALLKCPGRVRPLKQFTVTMGLSESQVEGIVGGKLRRPDSSVGPYTLTVRLVHDGFQLDEAETSEVNLRVTADDPYPAAERHLTALMDESLNDDRVLLAQYYANGQMIGAASRHIEVTAEAVETGEIVEDMKGGGCDMTVPTHKNAPDMTLTISSGNTARGDRLIWSVDTIHPQLKDTTPIRKEELESDLGRSPDVWAKAMMNQVNSMEGDIALDSFLVGIGEKIAEKIPYLIRKKLVELSNHITDRAPTLLIISAEPHVPWELTYMWLGEHRSESFLAMEFTIGRWILGTCDVKTDKPKPPLPPPDTVTVQDMFVVSGDYSETKGWNRLEAAEEEAVCLQERYHATPVNATKHELVPWMKAGVDAELIHFSLHGKYDPTGTKDGLALIDGDMLDPRVVRGMTLKRKPFVFLNACQVGQGNTILGDYGGMAEAFLHAEASGVIAPLWSVDDKMAKGIAERFYKGLEDGEDPGELVRRERQGFKGNPQSGTFLAYLFFGHPRMRIIGMTSQEGDQCDE